MKSDFFSLARLWAVMRKEFIQLRRDKLTFRMMIGIPLIQLTLFGFAINSDPKHLPTAVLSADHSVFSRSFLRAVENTGYFEIVKITASERDAHRLLQTGEVQFVINIPTDFGRRLQRGERPTILVEADATDPAATSNAVGAVQRLAETAVRHDLTGPLSSLQAQPPPFELQVHRRYNPEGITQYNIVPGLMGVILTMTMIMMTALAVTRENERGTMENLLATPVSPFEVMLGKILPYVLIGYLQVGIILGVAVAVFGVPIIGSLTLLMFCILLFIAANLTVGITFSTIVQNQMQAMQVTLFFFLPSILMSGFMFPFRGMPHWAQAIGELLPLTHFLRIVRGIFLKGNGVLEVLPNVWPLLLFMVVVMGIGVLRFRRTLD